MPRVRPLLALLVPALLAPAARADKAPAPFRYPEGKHGKGELKYVNGLPVLTVEGTPEEIGTQIGVLALKPARPILEKFFERFVEYQGAKKIWPFVVKACGVMVRRMPEAYQKELDAMAKAAGLDRDKLVVGNTILDVMKIGGCSTLVVEPGRSAGGGLLFGRNLDFPSFGLLPQFTLVTVYRPRGKHAFVSVGFPGLIGAPSGMNDAGLAMAANEIREAADRSPHFDPEGLPMVACYRLLLEECGTVAEAEKRVRKMKRSTMGSVTVCDKAHGAVFEITTRSLVVRGPEDGLCACTNHFRSKALAKDTRCRRYEQLKKCWEMPKLKLADVTKKLHEINQGEFTIHTMVFEPASLRLHLAFGNGPSSKLPLRVLDLAPRLRAVKK